jgi:hypothetical protein
MKNKKTAKRPAELDLGAPIQLQIVSGGNCLAKMNLNPCLGLRLMAFADTNKITFISMVDRALRFATAPEGGGPDLSCPDEEDIVEFAAKALGNLQKARAA